jgi:hypothetical protein
VQDAAHVGVVHRKGGLSQRQPGVRSCMVQGSSRAPAILARTPRHDKAKHLVKSYAGGAPLEKVKTILGKEYGIVDPCSNLGGNRGTPPSCFAAGLVGDGGSDDGGTIGLPELWL